MLNPAKTLQELSTPSKSYCGSTSYFVQHIVCAHWLYATNYLDPMSHDRSIPMGLAYSVDRHNLFYGRI